MVEPSVSVLALKLSSEGRHNNAIAYPDPDIPTLQAVGYAVGMSTCHIKMVDDTDNQKKVENSEKHIS